MEARVVGGCVALLAAALACDAPLHPLRSLRSLRSPSKAVVAEPPPAPTAAVAEEAKGEPAAASNAPVPHVVVVTLDGVRWEEVFDGPAATMPALHRIVRERGVLLGGPGCPNDVRASGPNFVSFPGYVEMFTGKPATCFHNSCPPVDSDTVLDEARAAVPRAGDVAVVASWGKYAHATTRHRSTIFLSAGARRPALAERDDAQLKFLLEVGAANAGFPGHGDYRPDVHTARIALRYLETQTPRVLVVGLGDADEHAHRGDGPSYRRAIRRADDFLGELDHTLEKLNLRDRTAVLVTTDHGRAHSLRGHGASFPESQRVFFAAFGGGIAHRGIVCASEPLRLAHLANAMRNVLGLERKRGPLAVEIME